MSYGHALKTIGRRADARGGLPARAGAGAAAGRGVVEPRQPEDPPVRGGRHRGDARPAGARRPRRRGPPAPRLRAGQGAGGRGRLRRRLRRIRQGQRDPPRAAAPCRPTTSATRSSGPGACSRADFLAARRGGGCAGARSDLHRRPAALRLDPGGADPGQPFAGRGHHGAARPADHRAAARPRGRLARARRLSGSRSPRCPAANWRALGEDYLARDARPPPHRPAAVHRQAAEQLAARRPDPADPAERHHHRRAAPPARLLPLRLQAALRPRPGLQLRPRRHRPLLPRLRGADGALRRGVCPARSTG